MFNWFKNKIPKTVKVLKTGICPYCQIQLEKFPTRKQKCKSCNNDFVVRTHYKTKEKVILTEKGAEKYDLEKNQYYIDKNFIDYLRNFLTSKGKDFDKIFNDVKRELTDKFGSNALNGDIAWSIANKISINLMKRGDLNELANLYFMMEIYLHDCGKNYFHLAHSRFEIELNRYKRSGFEKVEVSATVDSCDSCKALGKKIFTIDDAITNKILPCKTCTHDLNKKSNLGRCRCCYLVYFEN